MSNSFRTVFSFLENVCIKHMCFTSEMMGFRNILHRQLLFQPKFWLIVLKQMVSNPGDKTVYQIFDDGAAPNTVCEIIISIINHFISHLWCTCMMPNDFWNLLVENANGFQKIYRKFDTVKHSIARKEEKEKHLQIIGNPIDRATVWATAFWLGHFDGTFYWVCRIFFSCTNVCGQKPNEIGCL